MTTSRDHLQARLNRLLHHIPSLQQEFPDPEEFWPVFASEADPIVDAARPCDHDWVVCRIDAMLEARGMLARDC